MSLRTTVSALALVFVAACTQGSDIASPGSTAPPSPPPAGGGGGGGGGGAGGGATCPTNFTEAATQNLTGFTICELPSGDLTADLTIPNEADIVYELTGRLNVGVDTGADGTAAGGAAVDLTIEPGVTIFGDSGADFIVVNRGSRMLADGELANPIVFTSEDDIARRIADPSDIGANEDSEWGGLVLLGSAPNNRCETGSAYFTDTCEAIIEGVDSPNAVYGGDDIDDDSGILRYVQVRFAGFELASGNELNGISFGGVGNTTTVEYVQVHNNSDDGVEFFGGTVDVKYLVLTGNDDESIDTDNGYQGTIQYALVVQTDGRGDNITEQSSVEAAPTAQSSNPLIANFTWIGTQADEAFKSNTGSIGRLLNGVIVYENACTDVEPTSGNGDAVFDGNGVDSTFNSVLFDCGKTAGASSTGFDDDANPISIAARDADGNNSTADNTLFASFFNGSTESGIIPFADLTTVDAAFDATSYIGAFGPTETPTANWASGWTFGVFADPGCPTLTTDTGEDIDGQNVCRLPAGDLTSDLTLTRGNIYELTGRLNVGVDTGADGTAAGGAAVDLTIEPGVTIFGDSGADFIVVNRGSRMFADGQRGDPIVFTSEDDVRDVQPNPATSDSEWGGLVLLGSAPNNRCETGSAYFTDTCEAIIEGVDSPNAVYGGDDIDDDSGVLRFVQVKYAGFELASGNELNGISFGGVGNTTTVEYVQVHNNSDDGVEFFGGTVDVKYLVLTGNDDESIDTDNGYQGTMQYVLVEQTTGRGDNITEQSSVEAAPTAQSSNPLIANFTWIGTQADEGFKSNTGSIGRLLNGVIVYENACTDVEPTSGNGDATFDGNGVDSTLLGLVRLR